MAKKKGKQQEAATTVIVDEEELGASSDEDERYEDLSCELAEIRKDKNVLGYILRNETSATIDIEESGKIVEYAIFSSQVLDSSQEISDEFELGDVESVVIEGEEKKVLCMKIGKNKINVFMKKDADCSKISKKLSP
jgi:predicted regulator of Ras-like GTPase activity (Roadblock/LC7/MglB family)